MAGKLGRLDPTRTTTLRQRAMAEVNKRFIALKGAINTLIVEGDALGIAKTPSLAVNTRWAFLTDAGKVTEFRSWLKDQIDNNVLETKGLKAGDQFWMSPYIASAYKQGAVRAYIDSKPALKLEKEDYFKGSKDAFLQGLFDSAVATKQLERLFSRSFQALEGVSAAMDVQMSRTLADGLAHGESPRDIARKLNKTVDGLGRARSLTIARTEIIHSHAEGQLDSFENLGVTDLGVMAEWSTTKDDKVCPLCRPLDGAVFTVKEARGILPRHPNCRCAWVPANVGEPEDEFKAKRKATASKVAGSIQQEKPKGSLDDALAKSRWAGADTKAGSSKQYTKKKQKTKTATPPPIKTLGGLDAGEKHRFTDGGEEYVIEVLPDKLGGSTGARLVDINGKKYVAKDYGGNEGQVINEYLAGNLYRDIMPGSVPEAAVFRMGGKKFLATKYIENAESVAAFGNSHNLLKAQDGFVLDAMLANWDVAGSDVSNIVSGDGKVYRIDNGGALSFRAQGGLKGSNFGSDVNELVTLRDPSVNPGAAVVFGSLSDRQVAYQIGSLQEKISKLSKENGPFAYFMGKATEAGFSSEAAAELSGVLEKRLGYLLKEKNSYLERASAIPVSTKPVKAALKTAKPKPVKLSPTAISFSDIQITGENGRLLSPVSGSGRVTHKLSGVTKNDYKSLTKEERDAIYSYTGMDFARINEYILRGSPDKEKDNQIANIQSGLAKLPKYTGYTARGITQVPGIDEKFENWKSGKWAHIEWKAFSSTAAQPGEEFESDYGVTFIVKCRGKNGSYVKHASQYPDQEEVLFQAGSKFRVTGWAEEDGIDDFTGKKIKKRTLLIEEHTDEDGPLPVRQSPPKKYKIDSLYRLFEDSSDTAY